MVIITAVLIKVIALVADHPDISLYSKQGNLLLSILRNL